MATLKSTAQLPSGTYPDQEFVGDHPVMDLLNTVGRPEVELVDFWQSDADVVRWMARAGWMNGDAALDLPPGKLLEAAHQLREMVRRLVVQRKKGKRLDSAPLNDFLGKGRSYCELTQTKSGELAVVRRYESKTSEQWLAPLAEAAAEFLATANFNLVRACEGEGCVLWFYDRTKSHRRRWCSMRVCGNRHKVASFRSRNSEL
jgi:predicted RNA-binding Zn ribbon-like protein